MRHLCCSILLICIIFSLLIAWVGCKKEDPYSFYDSPHPDWSPEWFFLRSNYITKKTFVWSYDIENNENIQGFKIDRKIGDGSWYEGYVVLPKSARSWTDTLIIPEPSMRYYYRIYAYAGNHNSIKKLGWITGDFAPIDLRANKLSEKKYEITWRAYAHGEHGFVVDRKINNEEWVLDYRKLDPNTYSFIDTNVLRTIPIEYRIYAFYESYESSKTATKTEAGISEPSNLSINFGTLNYLEINWKDNCYCCDGYLLERKYEGMNWEQLAITTQNEHKDFDFLFNTNIFYRVRAFIGNYFSSWTETEFNTSLPPPENFNFIINSVASVSFTWDYEYQGNDGFRIERKSSNVNWEEIALINPELNSFEDNDIDLLNNVYAYRLCAYKNSFESSKNQCFVTPEIGMNAFGGLVFYLDDSGGGLICSNVDQSTDAEWGCAGVYVGNTGGDIGDGNENTTMIISACKEPGIAARICEDLVINEYSDWFLPSKGELNLMYNNLKITGLGSFEDTFYWSSTEYNDDGAWAQNFNSGFQYYYYKESKLCVRAVRRFHGP
nr:DUF1566 domain-containing protein [Bacteroidota bacterium]